MSAAPRPGAAPEISYRTDATSGRRITRLRFGGWWVEIDGATVTVPHQRVAPGQNCADLAVCLAAAHSLTRRTPAASAARRTPASSTRPADGEQTATTTALVEILRAARSHAAQHWHPVHCDLYACLSAAWSGAGMVVAYAALVQALRRTVAPGTRLIDVNDRATRTEICALFDRAIAALDPAAALPDRGAA